MSYATQKMNKAKMDKYQAKQNYCRYYFNKHGHVPGKEDLRKWSQRYDKKKRIMEEGKQDTFQDRLIYTMGIKGIKSKQLAKDLYVSKMTVCEWRNTEHYPTIPTLILLSDYLGVTLDYLLKGNKNESAV